MDAILPYRLHLVLENSQAPNYWTEKIADAYLGWAYPVYLGCPNLGDFFPEDSFTAVGNHPTELVADTILRLLDLEPPTGEEAAITTARERVLNEYNPFAWSARWAKRLYRDAPPTTVTLKIHKAFRPFPRGALYRLRQLGKNPS
jgi:hypothetical protein